MREDKISLGDLIELAHSNFGGNVDYDRVMVEVDYEYFGPCEPDDDDISLEIGMTYEEGV